MNQLYLVLCEMHQQQVMILSSLWHRVVGMSEIAKKYTAISDQQEPCRIIQILRNSLNYIFGHSRSFIVVGDWMGIIGQRRGLPVNPHRWKTFQQSSVFSHQSILSFTELAPLITESVSRVKPCMALRPDHIIVSSSSSTTASMDELWAPVAARSHFDRGAKWHKCTDRAAVSLCPTPGRAALVPAQIGTRTTERKRAGGVQEEQQRSK